MIKLYRSPYNINSSVKLKTTPLLLIFGLIAGTTAVVITTAGYGLIFGAILVSLIFLIRPDLGIYAAIIFAPLTVAIGSIFRGNLGDHTLLPVDMLFLLVVTGAFIRIFFNKGHTVNMKPAVLVWITVIFLGLGLGLLSGYEATLREGRGLLWYFIVPLYPVIFKTHQDEFALLKGLSFALFLAGCLVLSASFGMFSSVAQRVAEIGGGLYRNVGDTAISIPLIFLGLSWLIYCPMRLVSRFWGTLLISTGITVLMASVTRGFWIGFIVGLFVFALMVFAQRASIKIKKRLLAGFGVLIILAITSHILMQLRTGVNLIQYVLERFQFGAAGIDENVIVRIIEAQAYFDAFLSSPIWGHGIGSLVYNPFINEFVYYSHNEYLFILQTMGALGLVAFGWFFISTWKSVKYGLRSITTTPETKVLLIALAGILMTFFVTSVSSPMFRGVSVTPYLAVLIGFALAKVR